MHDVPLSQNAPALTVPPGGSGALVLLGGATTTAAALLGVFLLEQVGFNVMGFYGDYVLPIGAFLVGLAAASGCGLASWLSGTKISGRLLFLVGLLLAAGYFLAKYLEFRLLFPGGALLDGGTPLGFWGYFDATTRAFAFEDQTTHQPGSPLGVLGYGLRALEVIGFVSGGALIPWVLRKQPYCEACQRYERTTALAWIAASVPARRIGKRKTEARAAHAAEQAAATQQGEQVVAALVAAVRKNDGAALSEFVARHRDKAPRKLPARIAVTLVRCTRCHQGEIRAARLTRQGRRVKRRPIASQPLSPALVGQLTA